MIQLIIMRKIILNNATAKSVLNNQLSGQVGSIKFSSNGIVSSVKDHLLKKKRRKPK